MMVKLLRVAMLLPVILCASWLTHQGSADGGGPRPPLLPWFAVAFFLLASINSTGWLPPVVPQLSEEISRWCLLVAIAAIGLKTEIGQLRVVGFKPVLLMIGETVFLAALVLGLLSLSR